VSGSHPQLPRQVVVGSIDIRVDVALRRASIAQPIPSIIVREGTEAHVRQARQQGEYRAQVFPVAVAQEEGVVRCRIDEINRGNILAILRGDFQHFRGVPIPRRRGGRKIIRSE